MAQAEENLRLQRLRYQEGVGTATEVLDAVTLLTTAEIEFVEGALRVRSGPKQASSIPWAGTLCEYVREITLDRQFKTE